MPFADAQLHFTIANGRFYVLDFHPSIANSTSKHQRWTISLLIKLG